MNNATISGVAFDGNTMFRRDGNESASFAALRDVRMRGCVYFGRSCQEGVRDCRGATHDYEARSPSAHKDFRIWDGMG